MRYPAVRGYPLHAARGGTGIDLPDFYSGFSITNSYSGSVTRSYPASGGFSAYTLTRAYSASATVTLTRRFSTGMQFSFQGPSYFMLDTPTRPTSAAADYFDYSGGVAYDEFLLWHGPGIYGQYYDEYGVQGYSKTLIDHRKPRANIISDLSNYYYNIICADGGHFYTSGRTVVSTGENVDMDYYFDTTIRMTAPAFLQPTGTNPAVRYPSNIWANSLSGKTPSSSGTWDTDSDYHAIDASLWSNVKWQDYRGTYNPPNVIATQPEFSGSVTLSCEWTLS